LELCDLIAMQVHLTTMQELPLLRTMRGSVCTGCWV